METMAAAMAAVATDQARPGRRNDAYLSQIRLAWRPVTPSRR